MTRDASGHAGASDAPTPGGDHQIAALVASNPLWYHTIELGHGVVTPGWFDLRALVQRLPWPDLRGKRCLDIGTYDGFLAFELERRGAAEVVATDIADHVSWDWPPHMRSGAPERLAAIAGPVKGRGFEIAKEVLRSSVQRVEVNVYDLDPDHLGTFDFVVCGALMLHLRDPLRALEAIRGVCGGSFLSLEEIKVELAALHRRRPVFQLNGTDELCQWWLPSAAGHRQMLAASGFAIERAMPMLCTRYGPAYPPSDKPSRSSAQQLLSSMLTRSAERGLVTSAVLARPAF
jgi:tRNA (mo5U34)-methyltransferase